MVSKALNILACLVILFVAALNPAWAADSNDELKGILKELQQDMHVLRQEMLLIRQAVTEIHRKQILTPGSPAVKTENKVVDLPAGEMMLGNNKAKVAIIEYSDYECPFCARFHSSVFPKLKENYIDTGKVNFGFRDFPLGSHSQAKPAAIAARCSGQQGKYWEMQKLLFIKQRQLKGEIYKELASTLKLNEDLFSKCLQGKSELQKVEQDFEHGKNIGVRGTPFFLVGKIKDGKLVKVKSISGAQPLQVFNKAIEALL